MIKVSLILLAGLALARLLGSRSAALRHAVLAAAMCSAAAAPLLTAIAPRWTVASWQAPVTLSDGRIPLVDLTLAPSAAAADGHASPAPVRDLLLRVAEAVWIGGTAVSGLILLAGLVRLRRLRVRSAPLDDVKWVRAVRRVTTASRLRRPFAILVSPSEVPVVTWGLVRPAILVPPAARFWDEPRIANVVAHETAHIRRADWLFHLLGEVVRAVYWFNPIVWIAARQLREESERACDDTVLGTGIDGLEYAADLLALARAGRHALPAAAMARPSSLERRIRAMLDSTLNRQPATRAVALVAGLALVAIAVPIAGMTAAQTFSTFSGSILDPFGHGVPGAAIVLTNTANQAKYEVKSDRAGRFEFVGLVQADYAFEVSQAGFSTARGTLTLAGRDAQQNVTLQLGMIEETLNVIEGAPPREVRRAPGDGKIPPSRCAQDAGGCIDPPRKIQDMRPVHPGGTQGTVVVKGVIGKQGMVSDLQPVQPADPALAAALIQAVTEWRYVPTRLDGVPIDTAMTVTARFSAPPPPPPPPPAPPRPGR